MAISEDQLETWSHLGQTGQFTATYQTIKAVLDDTRAPYANRQADSFLQGSYKNETNVHGDSDVDIVLRTRAIYYSDTDKLKPDEKAKFEKNWSAATYHLSDFKNEVVTWLIKHYGAAVTVGPKAIKIAGNGTSRRDADVLVCAEFHRYYSYENEYNPNKIEGICFFLPDGTRIENFPEQHHDNCTTKHKNTTRLFKPTVRVYKNLRNRLIEDGRLADGVAPSYFLEGMLYNVPPDRFGGTHQANFLDTLNSICQADRSKFECANEAYYLLHDYSPVTWTAAKCNTFLNAAVAYWDE
jgi:hypothetical protein